LKHPQTSSEVTPNVHLRWMWKALVEWCGSGAMHRLGLDSIPAAGTWDMQRLWVACAKDLQHKAKKERARLARLKEHTGRRARIGRPPENQRALVGVAILADEIAASQPQMSVRRRFTSATVICARVLRVPLKDRDDFIENISECARDAYKRRRKQPWAVKTMEDQLHAAWLRPRLPSGTELAQRLSRA